MPKENKITKQKNALAQSIVELAVFGAILIFVVSLIFRTGLSASLEQNQDLRVLRAALRYSLASSTGAGADIPDFDPLLFDGPYSRASASVLLLEDRLSMDASDKYGTRDRVPIATQSSGTHSSYLFYPLDWGETNNLPITDIRVNGQNFKLRTAMFASKSGYPPDLPLCTDPPRVGTSGQVYGHSSCWLQGAACPAAVPAAGDGGGPLPEGCALFHKKVYNYLGSTEWNPACNSCFDLNFDGVVDVSGAAGSGVCGPGKSERDCFTWQWQPVYGLHYDWYYPPLPGIKVDAENPINTLVDIDNDYKEEMIKVVSADIYGRAQMIHVVDYQDGEMDGSWDDRDDDIYGIPNFGLQPGLYMYSITKDGTTYRMEEGQLLSASTNQYTRSTTNQDHADLIERRFNLANDNGMFCEDVGGVYVPRTAPNPVEACGECYSPGHVQLTCYEPGDNILVIRSRIEDKRRRRWLTINE